MSTRTETALRELPGIVFSQLELGGVCHTDNGIMDVIDLRHDPLREWFDVHNGDTLCLTAEDFIEEEVGGSDEILLLVFPLANEAIEGEIETLVDYRDHENEKLWEMLNAIVEEQKMEREMRRFARFHSLPEPFVYYGQQIACTSGKRHAEFARNKGPKSRRVPRNNCRRELLLELVA